MWREINRCFVRLLIVKISLNILAAYSYPLTNHELMEKLGFTQLKTPGSIHTKRLAVESRHQQNSYDDSHMFVIKLPPIYHYYAYNKPFETIPGKKIPVGFNNNGKPTKVYHWNIPLIKTFLTTPSEPAIAEKRFGTYDVGFVPAIDKNLHQPINNQNVKPNKSFYVPLQMKKNPVIKYFSGNGKPVSFYIIYDNGIK